MNWSRDISGFALGIMCAAAGIKYGIPRMTVYVVAFSTGAVLSVVGDLVGWW